MVDTLNRRTLYRVAGLHDVDGDARILYNVAGDENLDPAVTILGFPGDPLSQLVQYQLPTSRLTHEINGLVVKPHTKERM